MNLSNDAFFAPGLSQVNETICLKKKRKERSYKHITELYALLRKSTKNVS